MKAIKACAAFIGAWLVFYVVFAFANAEFDFRQWLGPYRFFCALFSTLFGIALAAT